MTGPEGLPGRGPTTYGVTVTDLATVQRLLVLLAGRRHPITRFSACQQAGGRWDVTLDCPTGTQDLHLLLARLARPPTVLSVRVLARG